MFNAMKEGISEAFEEHGAGTAIIVTILLIGIVFGVLCGVVAIAVALWNGCLDPMLEQMFQTKIQNVTFWQMWGIYLLFDILVKPSSSNSNK